VLTSDGASCCLWFFIGTSCYLPPTSCCVIPSAQRAIWYLVSVPTIDSLSWTVPHTLACTLQSALRFHRKGCASTRPPRIKGQFGYRAGLTQSWGWSECASWAAGRFRLVCSGSGSLLGPRSATPPLWDLRTGFSSDCGLSCFYLVRGVGVWTANYASAPVSWSGWLVYVLVRRPLVEVQRLRRPHLTF